MSEIKSIFEFAVQEETAYKLPIEPVEGWSWSMPSHLRRSTLYKNSQFEEKNDYRNKRPFKNIIRPILNVQYRTEGFDVKDIVPYVDNEDNYYKSFLVKKFHDKWAIENQIDTFIDNVVESYIDYGGVLVKDGEELEVVNLLSIAFADQTDILSGAFAIKHYFTPSQLREMSAWDKEMVEIAILKAETSKRQQKDNIASKTPTKYIEVYEIHGSFPDEWIKGEKEKYSQQIHIISFYQDDDGQKKGLSFFSKKEPKLPFKFLARDKIFGRALGFGGIEELFESQAWTNYSEIRIMEILDIASKIIYKTTDKALANRNKTTEMDNGEILFVQEGRDIGQLDTSPRNLQVFTNALNEWNLHAKEMGGASDIFLGRQPSAGTPFKSLESQIIEAKSLHIYRQGKLAVFMEEIYRDWVIPRIAKEIVKENKFLAELSVDELQEIADKIVTSQANKFVKEKILSGELVLPEDVEQEKLKIKDSFLKGGRKKFISILKDEFKEEELNVSVNIAGKQKDLAGITDKWTNILRQILSAPQVLDDPRMLKILNKLIESSGMSPLDIGGMRPPTQMPNEMEIPNEMAGKQSLSVV